MGTSFLGRTGAQLCALLLLVTSGALLSAQDRHLTSDPAAPLYRTSPFAHGYMHGYEDGFHLGTIELLAQLPETKKPKGPDGHKAYKDDFGDRHEFMQGYAGGFADGRLDARDRGFRAYDRMAALAQRLDSYDQGTAARFDQGLEAGYLMQRAGQANEATSCLRDQAAQQSAFCEGVHRGQFLAGGTPALAAPAVASSGGLSAAAAIPKGDTPPTGDAKPPAVAAPVYAGEEAGAPQYPPF